MGGGIFFRGHPHNVLLPACIEAAPPPPTVFNGNVNVLHPTWGHGDGNAFDTLSGGDNSFATYMGGAGRANAFG